MSKLTVAFATLFVIVGCGSETHREIISSPPEYTSMIQMERFNPSYLGVAPETINPRKITPYAIEMIKNFEGWSETAYDDPSGYCTIGYGHLIELKNCDLVELGEFSNPMTLQQGHELLELDTRLARKAVEDLVQVKLSDSEFSALSSFVYNVGRTNFSESTLLKLLNQSNYEGAAKEFQKWIYSKKVVLDGLVTRRKCERHKFESEIGFDYSKAFNRTTCEKVLGVASGSEFYDIETGTPQ